MEHGNDFYLCFIEIFLKIFKNVLFIGKFYRC